MAWSLRVARAFGIPIRVHLTFLLIVGYGAFTWGARHGTWGVLFGIASTLLLFASVALHELGHSVVAQRRGLAVREILLLPFGGVALLDGKPKRPADELAIAVAGPAVNFVLATLLGLVGLGLLAVGALDVASIRTLTPSASTLLALVVAGNLSLGLFNLLPIFPMDGGRVLRAILAGRFGMEKGTRWAAGFGQIAAVGLGTYAMFQGAFVLAFIAVLVFFAAGRERMEATALEALAGFRAGDVAQVPSVLLEPGESVSSAMIRAFRSSDSVLPVVLGERLLGVVTLTELALSAKAGRAHEPVAAIASKAWIDVDVALPLPSLYSELERSRAIVAVVHEDGVPVGLVSSEHLGRAAAISSLGLGVEPRRPSTDAPAQGS